MTQLLRQLKALVTEAPGLITESRLPSDEIERAKRKQRLTRWLTNCESVLQFAAMPEYSIKFHQVMRQDGTGDHWRIAQIAGLLESASDMLTGGFTGSLRSLVQAEVFDTLIDQAESLLKSSHLVPAAVLGRIVLEGWLRDLAKTKGIPDADSAKASKLNERLKQTGNLSTPRWRQIQSGLDVGNAAAHGKVDEFEAADVTALLVLVRTLSG